MIETSHLKRGTAAYRRATLALFCAGFATFALLYCIQPLLPLLAAHFAVSAANSSLALSLTTLSLALCLLISGALAESWGRKPVMAAALGLASLLGLACVLVESWHLLLLLRTLLGLALSGLPALAMAYVGEEFDPDSLPGPGRSAYELLEALGVGDDATTEGLALVDDLEHRLLEGLEVLRREGLGDVEVVVEAVGDGRADAQFGVGDRKSVV